MFKNLIVYRIDADWPCSLEQAHERLQGARFVECNGSQDKSVGWIEPRGVAHAPLLESVAGQWVARLMVETRSLPGSVVHRKAQERAAQIEASTGRKPGKRELRDLKDEVRAALLPMAFTKQVSVWVWVDRNNRLLVIDTPNQARADEVLTLLVQAWAGFSARLINTRVSPGAAMADWLLSQQAPAGFSVDRECELKAADESKAVVRYARHRLDTEEVQRHVREGKHPTRLALTWNERVSFMLTEGFQLKKMAFLDVVFEDRGQHSPSDDSFDADVAIATGELQALLPDLLEALGGELEPGKSG